METRYARYILFFYAMETNMRYCRNLNDANVSARFVFSEYIKFREERRFVFKRIFIVNIETWIEIVLLHFMMCACACKYARALLPFIHLFVIHRIHLCAVHLFIILSASHAKKANKIGKEGRIYTKQINSIKCNVFWIRNNTISWMYTSNRITGIVLFASSTSYLSFFALGNGTIQSYSVVSGFLTKCFPTDFRRISFRSFRSSKLAQNSNFNCKTMNDYFTLKDGYHRRNSFSVLILIFSEHTCMYRNSFSIHVFQINWKKWQW